MTAWRRPGPLGRNPEVQDLNDGTLVRRLSPRPGLVGKELPNFAVNHNHKPPSISPPTRSRHGTLSRAGLQALQQGSYGPAVQNLQRQLNRRLTPSPTLTVDGSFGPSTQQAVIEYQQGVSIAANGIVDKQTWFYLLRGDEVAVTQASALRSRLSASKPTLAMDVWEMSLVDRFTEVLRRTGPKLPGSIRHEFEAMLTPTNLTIMAGTLVFWAASHVFGFGVFADVALLISGVVFLGKAIFDVAEALGRFLVITSEAENDEDLDEGASYLTIAITILGVAAFFAILTKIARRMGGSGASKTPETSAPPRTPPAPRPARRELPPAKPPAPRPVRREPPPTKPPAKPRVPSKPKAGLDSKYGPLGPPKRQPGEGVASQRSLKWGNPKSTAYGHSLSRHGVKRSAQRNRDRAKTNPSGKQGQFYDDNFIVEAEQRAPLTPGVHDVPMGRPVGRVYHKDGTVTENVTTVRVIRLQDLTLDSCFPID
jgi:hypothetical protein